MTKFEMYWKKVDAKKRKSFEHGQALWAQIAAEKRASSEADCVETEHEAKPARRKFKVRTKPSSSTRRR